MLRHLATLRDRLGERFLRGVVLYPGEERLPFGERLVRRNLTPSRLTSRGPDEPWIWRDCCTLPGRSAG